jgi:hypothetical protein
MTTKNLDTYYDPLTNRTLFIRPKPFLLKNVFSDEDFLNIKNKIQLEKDNSVLQYARFLGRFSIIKENFLQDEHNILLEKARGIFSKDLLPTYCAYGLYKGFRANLPKHVDDNGCTYTIDLCVSYKTRWPIFVEGQEFDPQENEAVCYYGEDQYHWRNEFTDPSNNEVEMIFFHFAEPEHWYFTIGPNHKEEIVRLRIEHENKIGKIK